MPNNPGRIEGDYSTGGRDKIIYADPPPGFGAMRKMLSRRNRYVITIAIALAMLLLGIAFLR